MSSNASSATTKRERISFCPSRSGARYARSPQRFRLRHTTIFLQGEEDHEDRKPVGLQQAFVANFPIQDAREIFTLEYLDYRIERPKYTVEECRDRELTYAASLKARLRLSSKADEESDDYIETIEQEVYMGNVPMMTDRGTFVINGAERVCCLTAPPFARCLLQ